MGVYLGIHVLLGIITVLYLTYDRTEKKFDFFPIGMLGGWFYVSVCVVAFIFPPPFLFAHAKDHWQDLQFDRQLNKKRT